MQRAAHCRFELRELCQRGWIRDESLLYVTHRDDSPIQIVGVMRSADAERRAQIDGLGQSQAAGADRAPQTLQALQAAALRGENVFASLMEAAKVCSLG